MPSPTPDQLKVVINPYAAVDHKGRPAGLWLALVEHRKYRDNPNHPDPSKRFEPRTFVGAKRVSTRIGSKPPLTVHLKNKKGKRVTHTFPVPHDHSFVHSKDVQSVANTLYNRHGVMIGAIFAADVASYVAAGGDASQFVEPATLLAWAKEGAIAQFLAHHYPAELAASRLDPSDPKYVPLEQSMVEVDDARLEVLAAHWDGAVAQGHAVGAMFAAGAKASKPEDKASAKKATGAKLLADRTAARDAGEAKAQADKKAAEAKAKAAKPAPDAPAPAAIHTAAPAPSAAPAPAPKGGK